MFREYKICVHKELFVLSTEKLMTTFIRNNTFIYLFISTGFEDNTRFTKFNIFDQFYGSPENICITLSTAETYIYTHVCMPQ